MLAPGVKKQTDPETIAHRLTTGYADHGFCINVDEAASIGLNAIELMGEELDVVWEIHRLNNQKRKLQKKIRGDEVMEMLKDLPPELLEKLRQPTQQRDTTPSSEIP